MDTINFIPAWYNPTPDQVNYYVNFPPFKWSIWRAEGWLTVVYELTFQDKIYRPLQLSVARVKDPPEYQILLNLRGFDIVEFNIKDLARPVVSKYLSYPVQL